MSTNTGLITPAQVYYDKVFLERAKIELRHDFGAQVRNVPLNSGAVVRWSRFTPLALVTSSLSEASNPAETSMTSTQVSATLAEYGAWTQVGSLFSMTQIDVGLKEHVEVHGQNAGESIDRLIRETLHSGATVQVAAGAASAASKLTTDNTAITSIHTTDIFSGSEIRAAVRTLKKNKAMRFENGLYRGIIGPDTAYDLFGNSEWLDAHRYTTSDAIERGVVGKLHGVEFVESNNQKYDLTAGLSGTPVTATSAGVVTVYDNFIFGKNSYGVINLGSITTPKVYVKNPGPSDTSNPLDMYSTVGWKMPFATTVLNANWIIVVKTGATGGINYTASLTNN